MEKSAQRALRAFLDKQVIVNALAVTLTFKKAIELDRGSRWHTVDELSCQKMLKQFLNQLNFVAYNNARRKCKLQVIPVLEKGQDGRYHYHIVLSHPPHLQHLKHLNFEEEIKTRWLNSDLGYQAVDIQKMYSGGWLSYILKSRSKQDFETLLDAVDFSNMQLTYTEFTPKTDRLQRRQFNAEAGSRGNGRMARRKTIIRIKRK